MDIFNLTATVTLDTSNYKKGIEDVKKTNQDVSSSTEKNIQTIATNAWVQLGSTVLNVAKQIAQASLDLVNYADKYGDLSAKYDISSQSLQEFEYIASQSGATLETLLSTMTMMYNRAKEGDEVFDKLGVSVTDVNGNMKSMDTLFWEVKEALDNVENSGDKSALMLEAFGRNAMSVGEFLRRDTDELKALAQEANDLGIVLDESVIDKAGGVNDAIDEFKLRWQSALSALILGQEDAVELFENVLYDTIDMLEQVDWGAIGSRIAKALLKGLWEAMKNSFKENLLVTLGKGWLWGREESSDTEEMPDLDDAEIMNSSSFEVTERSSQVLEVKVSANGSSPIDENNAEMIAQAIVPYIDKNLGVV